MTDEPISNNNIVLELLYKPSQGKLIPEPDKTGNIEYKLHLSKKDKKAQDNMVSQMLWRMNEGKNKCGRYEAHYILGVHDDGSFSTINERTLNLTTNILRGVAKKANANIVSEKIYVFGERMLSHVVIRKNIEERHVPETNIMIMGPPDVGKSSLMGRLTYGQKDDGKGFSRKLVLRHIHEKSSGSTSCPKYDTIGFAGDNLMNYSIGIEFNLENIYNASDRLVNLIDTPGDTRCIKTIMYTMSSIRPDSIIVCVPCVTPVKKSTHIETDITDTKSMGALEYIMIHQETYKFIISACLAYDIKPIIVLTKVDLIDSSKNIAEYREKITSIFNEWMIELIGLENIITIEYNEKKSESTSENTFDDISMILVSNVTDQGYTDLISYLSKIVRDERKFSHRDNSEDQMFIINDSFTIPDAGTIFHGTMISGTLNVGDSVDILCHGALTKKKIKSIHRKTLDVERLFPGESGCVKFHGKYEKSLDKTAMIVGPSWQKKITNKATIMSMFSTIKIKPQQYTMSVNSLIVPVILTQSDEPSVYVITCVGNFNFVLISKIGILRDERRNYFFIRFI
jgi:GTPase